MLEVALLTLPGGLPRETFDVLLTLLPPGRSRQARVSSAKRRYPDAVRSLMGELLARGMISRLTGLAGKTLDFSRDDNGKPCLSEHPGVHFNISHAGEYVACAVSDRPVGIDVEKIRPFDSRLPERFFTPDEAAYVKADCSPARFFEIWTRKESRIKLEGVGLSKPLTSFSVLDAEAQPGAPVYHKITTDGTAVCHLCTDSGETPTVTNLTCLFTFRPSHDIMTPEGLLQLLLLG